MSEKTKHNLKMMGVFLLAHCITFFTLYGIKAMIEGTP